MENITMHYREAPFRASVCESNVTREGGYINPVYNKYFIAEIHIEAKKYPILEFGLIGADNFVECWRHEGITTLFSDIVRQIKMPTISSV
jgi:hypothetical protein